MNRLIYLNEKQETLPKARILCALDGAMFNLPVPKSSEENNFYTNLIGNGYKNTFWLGISDELNEGNWIGGDNHLTWENWNDKQPKIEINNYAVRNGFT